LIGRQNPNRLGGLLRLSCLLNRTACAALLGVSVKTVRNWDRGRHRVPWSAVKLLCRRAHGSTQQILTAQPLSIAGQFLTIAG
jgi:DNA-binding XRE family transcriptional regulator